MGGKDSPGPCTYSAAGGLGKQQVNIHGGGRPGARSELKVDRDCGKGCSAGGTCQPASAGAALQRPARLEPPVTPALAAQLSTKRTLPSFKLGTGPRFVMPEMREAAALPGPGAFNIPPTIGAKVDGRDAAVRAAGGRPPGQPAT